MNSTVFNSVLNASSSVCMPAPSGDGCVRTPSYGQKGAGTYREAVAFVVASRGGAEGHFPIRPRSSSAFRSISTAAHVMHLAMTRSTFAQISKRQNS